MKQKLSMRSYIFLSSMLFGMFFGAGNLIFPIHMGQLAGRSFGAATVGFCITGVGLPLLGIVAMGVSRSEGLFDLGMKVGKGFSYFFTCALYLTIGPLFAIPRTATVSFQVGILPYVPEAQRTLGLFVFSLLFFAVVLFFSLRPSGIMTWIGKILNPIFLFLLGILIIAVFVRPMGPVSAVEPSEAYLQHGFTTGLLEGYNTMDALASLAFGIILITEIRKLGVTEPAGISLSTLKSGTLAVALMALI
ncbi:MAG: branched-chain amino acid transport system II carrier protein, partial [Lachnospiraceae bacterium]